MSSVRRPAQQPPTQDSTPRVEFVIVGDWVIDEYRLLNEKRSNTSAHVGSAHFQSSVAFLGLCGAGHVARALIRISRRNAEANVPLRITGIGRWHPDDGDLLEHLVYDCEHATMPTSISNPIPDNCGAIKSDVKLKDLPGQDVRTLRVVRRYTYRGGITRQLDRDDDPLPPHQANDADLSDVLGDNTDGSHPPQTVVLVYDLEKGVVSRETLNEISSLRPEAQWYVFSKNKGLTTNTEPLPDWLADLVAKGESSFKLLAIAPEAVTLANPLGNWVEPGKIARASRDLLSHLTAAFSSLESARNTPESILVSTDRRQVMLWTRNENGTASAVTSGSQASIDQYAQVGWSSAVFAEILYKSVNDGVLTQEEVEQAIEKADEGAVQLAKKFDPQAETGRTETSPWMFTVADWAAEERAWHEATSGESGILAPSGHEPIRELHVWRAMSDLAGYVACITEKREAIGRIASEIKTFSYDSPHARPLNILLEADPGSGKTSLVEAFARAFELDFISRDVTQMLRRSELIDFFDEIARRQADGRRLLVFLDEVNANLEGNPVYPLLLSPLESGRYRFDGRHISPCIWVMATTAVDPAADTGGTSRNTDPSSKYPDFISRMNLQIRLGYREMLVRAGTDNQDRVVRQAQLEQVYLAAVLIRQFQPDVRFITDAVIRSFHDMNPKTTTAREIRGRVSNLSNISDATVRLKNLGQEDEEAERPVRLFF